MGAERGRTLPVVPGRLLRPRRAAMQPSRARVAHWDAEDVLGDAEDDTRQPVHRGAAGGGMKWDEPQGCGKEEEG